MARRTVRVEIPISKPDEFAKLLKKVVDKNTAMGALSPLKNFAQVNMLTFDTKRADADKFRADSENLRQQSETKMEQARNVFGTAKGQNVNTPGTCYNMVNLIKDFLLINYAGNEEILSEWGFKVVVGAAKSPTPKKKKE